MPNRRDWKRHVGAVCFSIGMVALVLALAHPQRTQKVPTNRGTVVLAIDTSLSMAADDVSPTRLQAAIEAAHLFLKSVPDKINIGIVAFHGSASVRVEPTQDRERASRAIDTLELGERTAIGEAIFSSLDAIKTVPPDKNNTPVPARIVLMSDGASGSGRPPSEAVAAARKAHVPIDTIAFGTDHGTITLPDSQIQVPVNVDRAAVRQDIADTSGGRAYTAASKAQIRDVYRKIGTSIGYTTKRHDVSGWFVGGGFVLLLLAAGASMAWQDRML